MRLGLFLVIPSVAGIVLLTLAAGILPGVIVVFAACAYAAWRDTKKPEPAPITAERIETKWRAIHQLFHGYERDPACRYCRVYT